MGSKHKGQYLTGKLLLAMPQMADTRFHKAVIFLCAHDENGAMGLMINSEMNDLKFTDLLDQLKINADIHIDIKALSLPVMSGGPVDMARGFLLHSPEFSKKDTINIDNSYGVTGTVDALKAVAEGDGPKDKLFILGYAGWEAGQLEQELQDNAWLVVDPDPAIIYNDDPGMKWELAMNKLGLDPALLSSEAGRA